MSILIKGMDMPTNCGDCPLGGSLCCYLLPGVPALWAEYNRCVREKRMHSHCPLVPVPPHGRLIDADALGIGKCYPDAFNDKNYAYGWNNAIEILQDAPAIIEAEKEKV